MFELIDLILAFVCGFIAAITFVNWAVNQMVHRIRQSLKEALKEADKPGVEDQVIEGKIIPLTIEVQNDLYYCYNSNTNQFVCQGADVEEIIQCFNKRFPGLDAALESGDEQALNTLRQQLKQIHENNSNTGRSS
jgi:ATP-dependent exoDNAse (exonuclease V) beta subunit